MGYCSNCKKEKDVAADGKSKGLCHVCYKKLLWKPALKQCLRCKKIKRIHAKGLCPGCYNSTFFIERVRVQNASKYHKISPEVYRKIVQSCVVCSFNKIVEIRHIDHNHSNNTDKNLIGLCPNHHKMIHSKKYQKEIFDILREKSFEVPVAYYSDGFFKK